MSTVGNIIQKGVAQSVAQRKAQKEAERLQAEANKAQRKAERDARWAANNPPASTPPAATPPAATPPAATPPAATPPAATPPAATPPAATTPVSSTPAMDAWRQETGIAPPAYTPNSSDVPATDQGLIYSLGEAGSYDAPEFQDAEQRQVVAGEDTVEGRLGGLLAAESNYIQRARARAAATANRRGLLNSSIAAGAGEAAAIDAALPIAQQDAQTYFAQGMENQRATNQFRQDANAYETDRAKGDQAFQQQGALAAQQGTIDAAATTQKHRVEADLAERDMNNRVGLIEAETGAQGVLSSQQHQQELGKIQAQEESEARLTDLRASHETAIQLLKGEQQQVLADTEAQWRTLVQQNATAGESYTRITEKIADIMNNKDLSAVQQQEAVDRMLDLLDGELTMLNGLNGIELIPPNLPRTGGPATTPAPSPTTIDTSNFVTRDQFNSVVGDRWDR